MRKVELEEEEKPEEKLESIDPWEVLVFQIGVFFVAWLVIWFASNSLNAYYNVLFFIGTVMLYFITGCYLLRIFSNEDNLKEKNVLLLINIGSIITYICIANKISIKFIEFLVLNFGNIVTFIRSLKVKETIEIIYFLYLPIFIALLVVFFFVRSAM